MGEVVNLRQVRKRAKREAAAAVAQQNRLRHGRPKAERSLHEARAEKAQRELEAHRIDTEGER